MKNLCAFFVLLFSVNSFAAGAFIEPFIGFDSTTVTATYPGGAKANSSSSGLDYGARLGYRFGQAFWSAAEYTGGSGKDDRDSGSNYKKSAIGLVLGYDLGRYSVWAGYGFTDELVYDYSPDLTLKGTNYKLGVGYEAAMHVNINLDLIFPKYTKASAGGGEVEINSVFSKFDVTTIMLSVSFPYGSNK